MFIHLYKEGSLYKTYKTCNNNNNNNEFVLQNLQLKIIDLLYLKSVTKRVVM